MPEIGEVARVVHYMRKHLLNKTLAKVVATEDTIVYGKVPQWPTSAAEFEKHMAGKKVIDVGQQGKYFWMIMSSPPHPVMHLGMSGWLKMKNEHTYYYKPKKGEENEEWPPKFWKFHLETNGKGDNKVQAAFVDMRRLARIRLVDCPGDEIRQNSPLKENGPDPVIDKDIVTVDWLREKCQKKKVPIKAMLLDQANISGIGNWVGDEIMYHSKIHPEQYANTLNEDQIKQLHKSIHYVCGTAVELLSDSDRFPEDWLFKHRWGKGKKDAPKTLPNGEKIVFLTVGGRTSAVVPSVQQKKTGPVAGDLKASDKEESSEEEAKPRKTASKKQKAAKKETEEKPAKPKGRKRKAEIEEDEEEAATLAKETESEEKVNGDAQVVDSGKKDTTPRNGAKKGRKVKVEEDAVQEAEELKSTRRGKKAKVEEKAEKVEETKPARRGKTAASVKQEEVVDTGRRRSGRNKK